MRDLQRVSLLYVGSLERSASVNPLTAAQRRVQQPGGSGVSGRPVQYYELTAQPLIQEQQATGKKLVQKLVQPNSEGALF